MRAVRFEEGKVKVQDVPVPSADSVKEGVKVKVRSAGICGSDVHMLQMQFPIPVTCGHEFAGELEDGTPVAVEPLAPCGECEHCGRGEFHLCTLGPGMILGVGLDGGMAEEVMVPRNSLIYLPANVDVRDACLMEPLAIAVHGLREAGLESGMRVAVVGGGVIGLSAVVCAIDAYATVGLVARHSHQLEAGEKLGARAVEGSYDLVVECAGTDSAIKNAVELCKPNGRLLLLGTYWEGLNFPHFEIAQKGLAVINAMLYSSNGVGKDYDLAAMLMSRNPEIAKTMITHRLPLEQAVEAFEIAADRKAGSIKVVLEP